MHRQRNYQLLVHRHRQAAHRIPSQDLRLFIFLVGRIVVEIGVEPTGKLQLDNLVPYSSTVMTVACVAISLVVSPQNKICGNMTLHRQWRTIKCPRLEKEDPDWKQAPASSPDDWESLHYFHWALEDDIMETCSRCEERWFAMRLDGGLCQKCQRADADRNLEDPYLCVCGLTCPTHCGIFVYDVLTTVTLSTCLP
jgi:hypothetical protein